MLENIFQYLIKLTNSIISALKVLLRSRFFLPKYKFNNADCFILGNGPSLNIALKQNSELLKEQTLICVNGFSVSEYFEKLKPSYYVLNAPEFWSKNMFGDEMNNLVESILGEMVQGVVEKTKWKMSIFLPVQSKENKAFIQYLKSNPHIDLIFYNTTPVEGLASINHLFFSLKLGGPRPHNVLVPSLLLAINAGVKNIYLLGADHSWLPLISVDDKNRALVNQKHFYDEDQSESKQMNKRGKEPRKLHEILEKFTLSFRAYFELKDYAATKGVKIYNCTPGSFIDAFDRKELENVLSGNAVRV
jgi:hypothetical protein